MSFRIILAAACLMGAAAAATAASAQATGAVMYAENCAACHQSKGEGVTGAFPALAGSAFVQGEPTGPAWIVTHGRGGMPNFSEDLDNDQIAAILTFIRSSWGNKAPAIEPATVASVRGKPAPPNLEAGLPFH